MRHSAVSPGVVAVLAITLVWLSIGTHLLQEYRQDRKAAIENSGNLARGFGETVDRMIDGVDQVMKILRNAYAADPAHFDLTRLVPAHDALDALTLQISTVDPHGMMTAGNLPFTPPVDLSDREHIKVHFNTAADILYISRPVLGRVSKRWSIQFTRKLFGPDHSFAGVLIVSLDPGYLARFYDTLDIGSGSISLIGLADGMIRARGPSSSPGVGIKASDTVLRQIRNGPPNGSFRTISGVDGIDRIYSYRRLNGYGMAVIVGLSTAEVFARFHTDIWIRLGIGTVLTLVMYFVYRAIERQNRQLEVSRQQLSATLENISQGIVMIDGEGRVPVINRRAQELLGLPPEMARGDLHMRAILDWQIAQGEFAPERDGGHDISKAAALGTLPSPNYERIRPNGIVLEVRTQDLPGGGSVRTYTDMTARRAQEKELQRTQQRLDRAERMEAIGQLTGGVAHDFNNLLAVVVTNLDMLAEETREGTEQHQMVEAALGAALHGADLIRQLLAFARRLPLEPRTMDINQLTTDMVTLLRRTLGEAITVTLTQDPDLWPVLADPGQLENAILNLAINARDAMPQGGTLHLETGRVTLTAAELADVEIARSNSAQPGEAGFGDYVMIAVIDTGTGMKPEILARVFDPFFTTKTDGKGTGLGLSMVYGFTSQSGGHLRIESSPGKGTAVRMYLPRVMGTAAPQPAAAPQNRLASLPHGHETILVVDDNAGIRETASLILQSLGYVVLEAGDGGEALALMDHAPHLDLLFTDVVMPGGINGPALARAATERWPDLAVLLTSGYVNPGIAIGDTADSPWDLLVKPYRREELALRVRAVLDEAAG